MALKYVGPNTKYWWIPTTNTTPGVLPSGSAAITCWFRLASGFATPNQALFGFGNGSTTYNGISTWSTGNVSIQFRSAAGGSGTQAIIANPTDQLWHFAAFQCDASAFRGGADGTAPINGVGGAQGVGGANQFDRVFFGGGGGIGFLNGSSNLLEVSDIAGWDNTLSNGDITYLYNGGTSGAGGSPKSASITSANLLFYLRLNSNFTDIGPNAYTTTAVGSPTATWVSGPAVDPPPGGVTVTVDSPNPTAILSSLNHNSLQNADWSSSLLIDQVARLEVLSNQRASVYFPAELLIAVRSDARQPIEWAGTLAVTLDAPMPLDVIASKSIDATSPVEVSARVQRDEKMPIAWVGAIGVTLDAAMPLDWMSTQTVGATSPVEWLRKQNVDGPSPVEWLRGLQVSQLLPFEFLAKVQLDVRNPGDFLSNIVRDEIARAEVLSVHYADARSPFSFETKVSADSKMPIEWSGALAVTLDASMPIDWKATLASASPSPLEFGEKVIADQAFSLEILRTLRQDAIMPFDGLSTVRSDAILANEWLSQIRVDGNGQIAWGSTVTVDDPMPTEWRGGITVSLDAPMPMDWTASLSVDYPLPFEFLGSILIIGRIVKLRAERRIVQPGRERRTTALQQE
jgi:hypothetical protein